MNAFRVPRTELPVLGLGIVITLAAVMATQRVGEELTLALLVSALLFFALAVGFIAAPHLAIAIAIPVFALLPTVRILFMPNAGPLKDLVSLAAIAAGATIVVKANSSGERVRTDFWAGMIVTAMVGLYVVNLGGSLQRDAAWGHGVRLVCIPLLLLLVGFTLGDSRRTMNWAFGSLIATGCFVALVGLGQQQVGAGRLHALGYEYDAHLRTIGDRFRSFGTLDDPFVYATFLLFALAAVLFWMRPGKLAYAAATLLVAGLAVSYVRTALIIVIALVGLWLARKGQTTIAVFFIGAALLVGTAVFIFASGGSETKKVRTNAGPSTYLTINERTTGWRIMFSDRGSIGFGKGVGEVGTAAERASYKLTRTIEGDGALAVDSGYLATVADVGVVGLSLLFLLFVRLLSLARQGIRAGMAAGWVTAGLTTVMLIDALTRESFTAYPNAFLGFLLLGLAAGVASDAQPDHRAGRPA